jgi:2-methylcitrate dehydratase PrpD
MTALTADLGKFVATATFDKLPSDVVPIAQMGFTDTFGVIMAGIATPVVDIVRKNLVEPGARREARACFSSIYVSAPDAALLGGTAAHALDYDDQSLSGHPSAVLVPAILAQGEALGERASGRDLVIAYVIGYEVWAELVRRDANYHRKGWHPTAVFGVIGAAAAAASLLRLPAERAASALAIAASHAGGLVPNFGTMTKPYHAGRAAQDGVISARLAAAGMTSGRDTLESPQGFLNAFSSGHPDLESPVAVGTEWYILRQGLCLKKYPTCYFMHRSFDATVKMLAGRRIKADDIANVEITMGRSQADVLTNERPKTGLEAKFSEQFAMAAAVILGRMGISEVADEVAQRPDFQEFYPKVTLNPVEEFDIRDPVYSPTERVLLRLQNGEVLDSGPIASARGQVADPMTIEEQWAKFLDCTALTHAEPQARQVFDMLQSVECLTSARALPTCDTIFKL